MFPVVAETIVGWLFCCGVGIVWCLFNLNSLSSNIQIQILHKLISIHFLKKLVERILTNDHRVLLYFIISIILITFPLHFVTMLLGEN